MSDTKTVTEREAVLRERRAWDECAYRLSLVGMGSAESEQLKNELYPLPTITRPRVVKDPRSEGYQWRCVGGALQWRSDTVGNWTAWDSGGAYIWTPLPDRVKLWADLLQNPLEEVQE